MKRRTFFSMIGGWVATCGAALGIKRDPRSIPNPDYVTVKGEWHSPWYSCDTPNNPHWEFVLINKQVECLKLDEDGNAIVILKHYDGTEATY